MIEALQRNGFIIFDLLDPQEVDFFNSLCEKYLPEKGDDFVSTSHVLSKDDSDLINREIRSAINGKEHPHLADMILMGGTLVTKYKGESPMKAHQDWSIVDESRFASYNLWIPLVDTDKQNGTLGLVPGSHLWLDIPRGHNMSNVYERYSNLLIRMGVEPSLKAGQAILYDHRLIHYSRPNLRDENRNVIIVGLRDRDADLFVCVSEDKKKYMRFEAGENDFYLFDMDRIIKGNKLVNEGKVPASSVLPIIMKQFIKHSFTNFQIEYH